MYDPGPDSKQLISVVRAAAACRVQARRGCRLGTPAVGLDLAGKRVHLADGEELGFDRVLIATTRARAWPNPAEAALDGVVTLRGRDDAVRLRDELAGGPRRVLVIGAGFTGSEIASACRALDLPGHVRRAHLDDRTTLEIDVAVAAPSAIPSGCAQLRPWRGSAGIACDAWKTHRRTGRIPPARPRHFPIEIDGVH